MNVPMDIQMDVKMDVMMHEYAGRCMGGPNGPPYTCPKATFGYT